MGSVHALELLVVPVGAFGALVLAVPDLGRRMLQSLRRRGRVEDELDHLPVALVQVVPVVEDVEEPVLKRELAGVRGITRDMRVHARRLPRGQPALPVQVVAAGGQRVPREVEVVLVEALREILRGRADLDEVAAAPGAAQRHRRLAEEHVHVDRQIRLGRAAVAGLCNEAHHRRVALCERRLLPDVGGRGRRDDQGEQPQQRHARQTRRRAHFPGFDTNSSRPSRRE